MAKLTVADWSSTAVDNTDIGGIGIQGTNSPANLDDAIREMMAQIKTFTIAAEFTGITTFTNPQISSSAPSLRFIETDATTDEKTTRFISENGDFFLQSVNDANTSNVSVLVFRRGTGTAWANVELNVPLVLNSGGADPMLAFDGDLDSGVRQSVANQVEIVTGNSNRVIINNTEVQILRPLNVTGTTTITGNTLITGTLTVTG